MYTVFFVYLFSLYFINLKNEIIKKKPDGFLNFICPKNISSVIKDLHIKIQ